MGRFLLVLNAAALFFISGCGTKNVLPDAPIVFEQEVREEYASLTVDDKIYVPYCPLEKKYLGSCIGYCDIPEEERANGARVYIFEVKGFSSEEWIIETSSLNACKEGMILREINATDIPKGLTSEYEWNE